MVKKTLAALIPQLSLEYGLDRFNLHTNSESILPAIDDQIYLIMSNYILAHLIENSLQVLVPETGMIKMHAYSDNTSQFFLIQDNGPGIDNPQDYIGKGLSTKGDRRGFGLFYANLYTQAISGRMILESSKNRGYKSIIQIPLVPKINEPILDYIESL